MRENEIRAGEIQVDLPAVPDAGLYFIGRITTPWTSRLDCPRQGRLDGPLCRIEMFEPWSVGLQDVQLYERLEILYWLDQSRRDLVVQNPAKDDTTRGVFSLRSPVRPNPIGTSIVKFERIEDHSLYVRGLDCLDGTPLLDIKPDRSLFTPLAAAQPGDLQTG